VRGMVMSRILGWKLMEDSNANYESLKNVVIYDM